MKIKLTQNKSTIVDDQDFNWLNKYKWCICKVQNTCYVIRFITIQSQIKNKNIKRKQKRISMHRLILEKKLKRQLKSWEEVDHINRDGLDNRRSNLRSCDRSKNRSNSAKQNKKTTSKYKGVCWDKKSKKWRSQIGINKKRIYLGFFENEIDAARTYNEAALKYFGEFARINLI